MLHTAYIREEREKERERANESRFKGQSTRFESIIFWGKRLLNAYTLTHRNGWKNSTVQMPFCLSLRNQIDSAFFSNSKLLHASHWEITWPFCFMSSSLSFVENEFRIVCSIFGFVWLCSTSTRIKFFFAFCEEIFKRRWRNTEQYNNNNNITKKKWNH